ncbi:MAG: chemotaxis protein CheX [Planctomycetes bacterium]|nr:chemotaxis protein CheX [Planctomycetota bacterium]
MDIRFINPFVASIQCVFETMVHTKVRVGKPRLRTDDSLVHDISAVVGFSGDAAGCVVLSFSADVACRIASAFAGTKLAHDDPDFIDAIGELANMVAGNAKKDFEGLNVSISLPSVIAGTNHTVSHPAKTPFIVIPCDTDFGCVCVEFGIEVEKKPRPALATTKGASV